MGDQRLQKEGGNLEGDCGEKSSVERAQNANENEDGSCVVSAETQDRTAMAVQKDGETKGG